jgi:hypothetical protein
MNIVEKIMALYPSLTQQDFSPINGTITLQNNSDGKGDYIRSWNHPTLTQPTPEQLAAITS